MTEATFTMKAKINKQTCFLDICHTFLDRDYVKTQQLIQKHVFDEPLANDKVYQSADDFVYKMDITSLSYKHVFNLTWNAINHSNLTEYILGMKIILVKLKANQRYAYFDRQGVSCLVEEIKPHSTSDLKSYIVEKLIQLMPVGFPGMTPENYSKGSSRSFYEKMPNIDTTDFEKEYEAVVNQGTFYTHIVELDHLINNKGESSTLMQWTYLSKLLTAYYATEKDPWTMDLTSDLLCTYQGIESKTNATESSSIIYRLVTGTLKVFIKRLNTSGIHVDENEIMHFINYLENVHARYENQKYLEYINLLTRFAKHNSLSSRPQ